MARVLPGLMRVFVIGQSKVGTGCPTRYVRHSASSRLLTESTTNGPVHSRKLLREVNSVHLYFKYCKKNCEIMCYCVCVEDTRLKLKNLGTVEGKV